MSVTQQVNPPPIPRIPERFIQDVNTRFFFQEIQKILLQLWLKTGAGGNLLNDSLVSLSSMGTAADKGLYTTAASTFAEFDLSAFARTFLDDADASTFRTTVGLAIGSDVQAYSGNLDEAAAFFAATDITGGQAEVLSDGSNADSLHRHSTTGLSDVTGATYTPTLTDVANLDSSTAYVCQYMRVGAVVTVSGKVDVDPTAGTTTTQLGISLPVASTLSANQEVAGAGSTIAGNAGALLGDTVNDRAQLEFVSAGTSSETFFFTFTYLIPS